MMPTLNHSVIHGFTKSNAIYQLDFHQYGTFTPKDILKVAHLNKANFKVFKLYPPAIVEQSKKDAIVNKTYFDSFFSRRPDHAKVIEEDSLLVRAQKLVEQMKVKLREKFEKILPKQATQIDIEDEDFNEEE